MTYPGQLYYCMHCKNIVRVVGEGEGVLVCCGTKMKLLVAKTEDQGKEKHIPVVEKKEDGILVKIGDVAHPMDEAHYITWIQLEIDGITYEKTLDFDDEPQAFFPIQTQKPIVAREVCNRHGLWMTDA